MQNSSNKFKYLALLISAVVHLLWAYLYPYIDKTPPIIFKPISSPNNQRQSPTQKWLDFILVETPENARSNKPPEKTKP